MLEGVPTLAMWFFGGRLWPLYHLCRSPGSHFFVRFRLRQRFTVLFRGKTSSLPFDGKRFWTKSWSDNALGLGYRLREGRNPFLGKPVE
jgi:hypothetical protein